LLLRSASEAAAQRSVHTAIWKGFDKSSPFIKFSKASKQHT